MSGTSPDDVVGGVGSAADEGAEVVVDVVVDVEVVDEGMEASAALVAEDCR